MSKNNIIITCVLLICSTILICVGIVTMRKSDQKSEPHNTDFSQEQEPIQKMEEPTPAPEEDVKPEDIVSEEVTEEPSLDEVIANPARTAPSKITDPAEWDGWLEVYNLNDLSEGVEISHDVLSYYCDVAGFDFTNPEDTAVFIQAARAIELACGVDVSSATAANSSDFPAVVKESIPFHLIIDGVTYFSFIKDDVVYVYGVL